MTDQSFPGNVPALDADHRPVMALLGRCPVYQPTPLSLLSGDALGSDCGGVYAKYEGPRMGLGSFKALGGSYAIMRLVAMEAGIEIDQLTDFGDPAVRDVAASKTFVSATAGNHGLSVAAASRLVGAKAVIFIAQSVPERFADRLRDMGAEVVREGSVYEEAMAGAMAAAESRGWTLISDTSWPGYTEIPGLIYQGYTALAEECRQQFEALGEWPDQVFVQAGVGGMAAAVAAHIRRWWVVQPRIVVVEPDAAPCLERAIATGHIVTVEGPVSNMGRLDCKEASLLTFGSLRNTADEFMLISDAEGKAASDLLGAAGLETTPSGAAGAAALLKRRLNKPEHKTARSLIIVSESA